MITTVCKISYGSQTVPPIVPAVQGDTGRAISFEIADFTPPAGATATYFILKPSGEAVYNSATITDNSILCELTAQSLAEKGENRMQVRVLQGEDIVTSFEVILMVRPFLGDDAIESGTEMNIFDQVVEQATEEFQTNAEQIVEEVVQSIPADYTALTEEVDELNERIGDLSDLETEDKTNLVSAINEAAMTGLTPAVKEALLNCFAHVGWDHGTDRTYYDALEEALYADEVKRISAVFTPGTHEVYITDNIESLRNFLVVTATYQDDTQVVVTDYTLEGNISSVGTKTITVKYGRTKTTTFTVSVVANTNGLLYEWDFTKGVTDLRQNQTGEFISLGEGSNAYIDNNGMHFTNAGQAFMCFPSNADVSWRQRPVSYFVGKTIQIDVASFVPNSADNDYHTRFITFRHTSTGWDSGLVYRATYNNRGWNVYNGSAWGRTNPWNMSNKDAISGHKISMFINSSKQAKIYVDGASKGVVSSAFIDDLFGLMIGNNDTAARGATLYTAIITGVRIYDGEVA